MVGRQQPDDISNNGGPRIVVKDGVLIMVSMWKCYDSDDDQQCNNGSQATLVQQRWPNNDDWHSVFRQ